MVARTGLAPRPLTAHTHARPHARVAADDEAGGGAGGAGVDPADPLDDVERREVEDYAVFVLDVSLFSSLFLNIILISIICSKFTVDRNGLRS